MTYIHIYIIISDERFETLILKNMFCGVCVQLVSNFLSEIYWFISLIYV